MAKPTYGGKASAGGRDDPQVKGRVSEDYKPGMSVGIPDPPPAARPGFRLVKELAPGEQIVSMHSYNSRVYVATTKGVYRSSYRGDVLEPLLFEVEDINKQGDGG